MKKIIYFTITALVFSFAASGCSDEDNDGKKKFDVGQSVFDLVFDDTAQRTVEVISDYDDFTHSVENGDWLSVDKENSSIKFAAELNTEAASRTAVIRLRAAAGVEKEIMVTQAASTDFFVRLEPLHDYDMEEFPVKGDTDGGISYLIRTNVLNPLENLRLMVTERVGFSMEDLTVSMNTDQDQNLRLTIIITENPNSTRRTATVNITSAGNIFQTQSINVVQLANTDIGESPLLGRWYVRCTPAFLYYDMDEVSLPESNALTYISYDKKTGYFLIENIAGTGLDVVMQYFEGEYYAVDGVNAGHIGGTRYTQVMLGAVETAGRSEGVWGVNFGSQFAPVVMEDDDTFFLCSYMQEHQGLNYLPIIGYVNENDPEDILYMITGMIGYRRN